MSDLTPYGQRMETRYLNDPTFHRVVDMMVSLMVQKGWVLSEFEDAARAAQARANGIVKQSRRGSGT